MPELQKQQQKNRKPLVDFDSWSKLARSDPEAFEARRAQVIEQMIQRMPAHKQQRMRCLQWKIDQVRARASNPLSACIKLSDMMWESLAGPGGLREVLDGLGQPTRDEFLIGPVERNGGGFRLDGQIVAGPTRAGGDRDRHGRLDSPARRAVGHLRYQTDVRPRVALRHDCVRLQPRPGRTHDALGGGRGAGTGGHVRL